MHLTRHGRGRAGRGAEFSPCWVRRHMVVAAAAGAAALVLARPVWGANDSWVAGNGVWSDHSNWSLNAPPVTGDVAYLTQSDAAARTVTFDGYAAGQTLGGLVVDATGSGGMAFSQPGSALVVGAGDEVVGYAGIGQYYFNGGSDSVGGSLYLGYNAGSSGTLYVAGSSTAPAAQATISGNQYVGYQGTGVATMSFYGTVTSSNVFVGYAPGSAGSYTLYSSGVAVKTGNAYIGGSETGPGGSGTLTAIGGTFSASGTLKVWNSPGTLVRLGWGDGNTVGMGMLSVGALDLSGNPALLSWQAGTLAVTGPAGFDASVLGSSVNLIGWSYPKTLAVTNVLSVPAGTGVSVSGGTVSAGAIDLGGNPSRLAWSSGTVAITGPAGLNLSALGASVSVGAGQTLAVSNTLAVPAGGVLSLGGGAVSAGAIDAGGDAARLAWSSGTLSVTGAGGLNIASLNPSLTVGAGRTLAVSNMLSMPAGATLTLSGGSVSAGSLDLGGDRTRLGWQSGTLSITGAGGMDLSTLGSSVSLSSGENLVVSNTATVPAGVAVNFSGGGLSANTLVIDGGSAAVSSGGISVSTLKLGSVAGTTGSVSVSGGGVSAQKQYIGYSGTGSFVQSGSVYISAPSLYLGYNAGASGTYSLSGSGYLSSSAEFIGLGGSGSLAQSGGTHTLTTNPLYLGYKTGSAGTYALSGGSFGASTIYVGGSTTASGGAGTFAMTGGMMTLASIKIWNDSSLFSLAGGSVQTSTIDTNGNPSRFSFTGGTLTITSVSAFTYSSLGQLTIGPTQSLSIYSSISMPVGSGLTMTGGSVSISYGEAVGSTGSATISQSGGTHAVGAASADSLSLGPNSGTTGTYILSGTGQLNSVATEYVGYSGTGKFVQSGGRNSSGPPIYLGYNTGSSGSYSLSGTGTLAPSGSEYIGYSGAGTFVQTGGSNLPLSFMYVGYGAGSSGTYTLSDASALLKLGPSEVVGHGGRGTFIHSAGTNSITSGSLTLGNLAGSSGTYSLSGTGVLSVAGSETVGGSGVGSLSQAGGTNTVGTLRIGTGSGSSGSYYLSGGSASASNAYVGGSITSAGGSASLYVNGGSLAVANTLKIWNTAGTFISLTSGSLAAGSLDTSSNPGLFHWTGGTFSMTGSALSISASGPLGSSLSLSPYMTLRVSQAMTVDAAASLSIGSGQLVLAGPSASLAWNYGGASPADTVRSLIQSGHLTSWGLDPSGVMSVGYVDSGSSVLAKLTLSGDANLDGKINADDYALLDRSLARGTADAHWQDGDFNYDGVINLGDYLVIDRALIRQGGTLDASMLAAREAQFGAGYVQSLLASVPEPSGTWLLALPALAVGGQRRRRSAG